MEKRFLTAFLLKNNMRKKLYYDNRHTSSPKNDKRGCLCKDGKTYSRKCCDGSYQAQGIGKI